MNPLSAQMIASRIRRSGEGLHVPSRLHPWKWRDVGTDARCRQFDPMLSSERPQGRPHKRVACVAPTILPATSALYALETCE